MEEHEVEFIVTKTETHKNIIEAESKEEAINMTKKMVEDGHLPDRAVSYEMTLSLNTSHFEIV